MIERQGAVTFQGNPLTLLGSAIQVGQKAPDFKLLTNELKTMTLKDCNGGYKVLCAVPSLDTPVCDLEIKRFNQEIEKIKGSVRIFFVSMDLPFAQSRFCQTFRIGHVTTLSDHATADFGLQYGVLIKELRLLSRAVFVLDQSNTVVYAEYVKEITQHPDYERILAFLKGVA